jgi:beta-glucosidase
MLWQIEFNLQIMKLFRLLFLAFALLSSQISFAQVMPAKSKKEMDKFVSGLMKRMTLDEKLGQLNLVTPGWGLPTGSIVSSNVEANLKAGKIGGMFGITGVDKIRKAQDMVMQNTRLKIPLIIGSDVIHGYQTTFPIPLGMSMSWDMDLIKLSAQVSASEASADGINWTFSPMVDIARDPRWGRVAEGAGEDPYLGSKVAAAYVQGYQGDLSKNDQILACVKHFALYGAAEGGRDYNTVDMSRLQMYQNYLPPYQAAVDAGVASVMSSFNVVDGIPATGNQWLLTEVLRKQWGFGGMVVSDYTSVNEMSNHGLGDLQTVSAMSLRAGLDMDMVGEGFLTTLKKSLAEKKVTAKQIDQACRRVLEAKYKLGLFTDPYRYISEKRAADDLFTSGNRLKARNVARASMVLLKNEKQALPLNKSQKIALIGPLASNRSNMLGTWAVSADPQKSVTVLEGMHAQNTPERIVYAKGCNISDDTTFAKKINVFGERIDIDKASSEQLIADAVALAQKSDVVVAIIGEASEMSGESASRTDIGLSAPQMRLLAALRQTGKPIVAVMMAGRPLVLTSVMPLVDALVFTGHPGTEAGNAVADVLYGAQNPGGKLTMTFPRNVGQIPIYYARHNTGRPQATDQFQKFQSNYLDSENSPLFPFGYGLSYSSFEYSDLKLSNPRCSKAQKGAQIQVSVRVKNTGKVAGDEVVQLYIRDLVGSVSRPVKELKGFQKVRIASGETKTITFAITESDLRFWNSNLQFVSELGGFEVMVGGDSEKVLRASFDLVD